MRAVVQRASGARVSVAGEVVGAFDGPGLVVLVGVTHDDTEAHARKLAEKVYGLRIFDAEALLTAGLCPAPGAREVSASALQLPILVISQFTLYGSTRKGRRPTWEDAAPGTVAEPLVDAVVTHLRSLGAVVATGRFGAMMQVSLVNDGPMTVLLEVRRSRRLPASSPARAGCG
jgi:D-tyrosyl-tRNA(Tyr) deacylase